jgi:hypothetical protein
MIADGVLEEGSISFFNKHFFLYKPGKLRLIFDGRKLNGACKTPPRFNMKHHPTLQRLAAKNGWYAGLDLKNMFFSLPIAESSRQYFGIRTPLGDFRYKSMPFGFSWSPFIAHVVVDQVVQRLIEEGIPVSHYLDDIHIFGGTRADCSRNLARVKHLLCQAGWRLNAAKEVSPCRRFTALGIGYDLVNKTSFIPAVKLAKLIASHLALRRSRAVVSTRQIAGFLGSFVFFNYAHPGSLAYLSGLIAFVSCAKSWDQRFPYASVDPFVSSVLQFFARLPPTPLQVHVERPKHVYSDATPSCMGLVIDDQQFSCRIAPTRIYEAESLAAQWLVDELPPSEYCLRIDNSALVFALRKGRSNTPEANIACKKLFRLRQRGAKVSVRFIRSEDNPADVPSRVA